MKPMTKSIIFIVSTLCCVVAIVYSAISLGTKFATVVLENLQPGGVYNVTKLRNLPLIVINSGDAEVDAAVEIEIPAKDELKEGYEPIPDPSWIKIIPDRFKIAPKEEVRCEVIISIPDDKSLIGKHYQFKIWSHTVGEESFGVGVVNKMFFSIGTLGPESLRMAKMKQALFSVEMDVSPEKIYLTVPAGKKINIAKDLGKAITVVNKGNVDIEVKCESVGNIVKFPIPAEYSFTPDTQWLTFVKDKVKVKKRRMEDVKMILNIPDEEKYYNQKFMFIVKTTPVKPELPMEFYTRVFVTVKKD